MVVPGMKLGHRGRKHDDVFLLRRDRLSLDAGLHDLRRVLRGYQQAVSTRVSSMSDLAFDPEYSWNYEVGFVRGSTTASTSTPRCSTST